MLRVSAFQGRDPVVVLILMKADDRPWDRRPCALITLQICSCSVSE